MHLSNAVILSCLVFAGTHPSCDALQIWTLSEDSCGVGRTGVAVNVTAKEFYSSFASIFRLSDGSSVKPPSSEGMESIRYMQVELLYVWKTIR
jgi:hypothetical protein